MIGYHIAILTRLLLSIVSQPAYQLSTIELPPLEVLLTPTLSFAPMECPTNTRKHFKTDGRGITVSCRRPDGRYFGEQRLRYHGHLFPETRYYVTRLPRTIGDGTEVRFSPETGLPTWLAASFNGKVLQEYEFSRRHITAVRMLDKHGDGRVWAFRNPESPATSFDEFENSLRHGLSVLWNDDGTIKWVKQHREGLPFGRWIHYDDTGEFALFATCVKSTPGGEGKRPNHRYIWKMPRDHIHYEGGDKDRPYDWVSLESAKAAWTRPCTIDGIEIPPITEADIPERLPPFPPMKQIPGLTWVLPVELPAKGDWPARKEYLLVYTQLVDAGPWRDAVMDAFAEPSGTLSKKMWHEAPGYFVALWRREPQPQAWLSTEGQIVLARWILSWLEPTHRAALMAKHGLDEAKE